MRCQRLLLKEVPEQLFSMDALTAHFSESAGALPTDIILRDKQGHRSALISFNSSEDATKAAYSARDFQGSELRLMFKRTQSERRQSTSSLSRSATPLLLSEAAPPPRVDRAGFLSRVCRVQPDPSESRTCEIIDLGSEPHEGENADALGPSHEVLNISRECRPVIAPKPLNVLIGQGQEANAFLPLFLPAHAAPREAAAIVTCSMRGLRKEPAEPLGVETLSKGQEILFEWQRMNASEAEHTPTGQVQANTSSYLFPCAVSMLNEDTTSRTFGQRGPMSTSPERARAEMLTSGPDALALPHGATATAEEYVLCDGVSEMQEQEPVFEVRKEAGSVFAKILCFAKGMWKKIVQVLLLGAMFEWMKGIFGGGVAGLRSVVTAVATAYTHPGLRSAVNSAEVAPLLTLDRV